MSRASSSISGSIHRSQRLRLLLREIFSAAGGIHDDWDAYDQAMREERRAAVLVGPAQVYSNPA